MSTATPDHESLIDTMLTEASTMISGNEVDGAWSKLKTIDNMPGEMTDAQGARWMRLVDEAYKATLTASN